MKRKRTASAVTLISVLKTSPSEHSEQVGFVNWFNAQYPRVLIFAIPNGEKRSITVAKRLKAEGVVRGIPDLFIPEWRLWVEMKRKTGGRLSTEQKSMINYLQNIGYTVIVGIGAGDASRQVLEFVRLKNDSASKNS
jgi:hypothetical protein